MSVGPNGWRVSGRQHYYWENNAVSVVVVSEPEAGTWLWRFGAFTGKGSAYKPTHCATLEEAKAVALATWRLEGGWNED